MFESSVCFCQHRPDEGTYLANYIAFSAKGASGRVKKQGRLGNWVKSFIWLLLDLFDWNLASSWQYSWGSPGRSLGGCIFMYIWSYSMTFDHAHIWHKQWWQLKMGGWVFSPQLMTAILGEHNSPIFSFALCPPKNGYAYISYFEALL